MTLTEVVVSVVILGISSQVSLQGWSRTTQAAATSARTDQQVRLLEQRLLAIAPVADVDCRWDADVVVEVLEGLPKNADLETSWRFEPSADGLWLAVELTDLSSPNAANAFKRSQLFTPAGLGHCRREVSDAQ